MLQQMQLDCSQPLFLCPLMQRLAQCRWIPASMVRCSICQAMQVVRGRSSVRFLFPFQYPLLLQ
ncbi:MAG TPA: hypothetical protein D7I16_03110 [Candidatus Poseidoniales archaeon]|nr:MAG TPA: hypothetical protein D7I16_03110 [Candidatus Poseidoniales archaeon]